MDRFFSKEALLAIENLPEKEKTIAIEILKLINTLELQTAIEVLKDCSEAAKLLSKVDTEKLLVD